MVYDALSSKWRHRPGHRAWYLEQPCDAEQTGKPRQGVLWVLSWAVLSWDGS